MRGSGRSRRGVVLGFFAIVAVSIWAALVLGSATGGAAATPVLDHFECYTASATSSAVSKVPFSATPAKVLVKNKFAPGGFVFAPGAVQLQCNPAAATAVTGGRSVTVPVKNPDSNLLCRAITSNGLRLPASVTLKNRFGQGVLQPTAIRSLCMPSWKSLTVPTKFPAAAAPTNLDLFVCYTAARPSGAAAFNPPSTAKLKDTFGLTTVHIGAPNIMCLPSAQSTDPYGGPVPLVNATGYVVCFAVPPAGTVTARTVYAKNQFGVGALKVTRATEMCVPSTKVEVPPTTTTTAPGVVTAYSFPSIAGPYDIAAGSDGALWFTNYYGGSVGRITTDGTVMNFPDASISRPDGIEQGGDGAIWFANTGNSSIGRITADGTITNYANGNISSPYRVAKGPGLATWFTNSTSGSVGWVTSQGQVNAFYSPTISNPQGIAAGPDGAMWFANFYGSSIGRVTSLGVVSSYSGPRVSYPLSIAAGSDGAMWFTCPGNDSIGRIAMDGTLTSFTDPTIYGPIDIVSGSDGALWFTNYANNSIGRITTDGQITNYTDATISFPDGIAAGPDGAIWFTNSGTNTIGRISV